MAIAKPKTKPGFSIMETLVSIALLTAAIVPLYALQQTLANSAARIQTASDLLLAEENALAILQSIDPLNEREGDMELGEWRLNWTSEIVAHEDTADGYLGSSLYSVSLVEITATLERGPVQRQFTVRRVGWRQVRNAVDF